MLALLLALALALAHSPQGAHDPNGPILTKDGEHTLVQNTLPHHTQMRSVEIEKDNNIMRKNISLKPKKSGVKQFEAQFYTCS